ncbi:MAG: enoyl-CoA hydratase/isomerase family protein [Melioribacteraceae bacterium]|nr:enoyl-CoA hydratase/isomerase family protein [Melioribacteraceae bacterium]
MKASNLEFEDESFKTYLKDSLGILEVKEDAYSSLTQINEGFKVIDWFEELKRKSSVLGILVLSDPKFNCKILYEKFLSLISGENLVESEPHKIQTLNTELRSKQINMLHNLTLNTLEFPKLVISFINGCVVTPFIGTTLASDIKIATKDTIFSFAHKKYGLHPTGAIPFFLYESLGYSRTKKLLYTKNEITANELLELGLIDKVIEEYNFDEIFEYANKMVQENSNIATTKELINKSLLDQYKEFMELEEHMVFS